MEAFQPFCNFSPRFAQTRPSFKKGKKRNGQEGCIWWATLDAEYLLEFSRTSCSTGERRNEKIVEEIGVFFSFDSRTWNFIAVPCLSPWTIVTISLRGRFAIKKSAEWRRWQPSHGGMTVHRSFALYWHETRRDYAPARMQSLKDDGSTIPR